MCCRYLENHLLMDESRASWLGKATVACTFLPSSRVLCSEGGTGDSGELKASRWVQQSSPTEEYRPKGQLRSEALTAARLYSTFPPAQSKSNGTRIRDSRST